MEVTPIKSGRRVLGDLKVNATFGTNTMPSPAGKIVKSIQLAAIHIDEEEDDDGENTLQLSPAKNVAAGRKRNISEFISDDDGSTSEEDGRRRKEERTGDSDGESGVSVPSSISRQASKEFQGSPVSIDDDLSSVDHEVVSDSEKSVDDQPTSSSSPTTGSTYVEQPDNNAPSSSATVLETSSSSSYHITEALKLRLQLAMYKVRTDQTHVPFDQLKMLPRKKLSSSDKSPLLPAAEITSKSSNLSPFRSLNHQQVPLSPSSLSRSDDEEEQEDGDELIGAEEEMCSSEVEDEDGSSVHRSSPPSGLPQLSSPPPSQIQEDDEKDEDMSGDDNSNKQISSSEDLE